MIKKLVVCVAKYPTIGKVKTRLGKEIGMTKSSLIQRKFLEELVKNNYKTSENYDFKICLMPIEKAEDFEKEFGVKQEDIFVSEGENLGSVMNNIFVYGFKKKYDEILLIGSDLATLNEKDFNNGFEVLKKKDIVLGESLDGGYYLVGMKKLNETIFRNIVYSTETVLEETINKCVKNNLSYDLLEGKMDIDTLEDLKNESKNDKTGFYKNIIKLCEV